MNIQNIVLMFMCMLLAALIIEPLAKRARLPFAAALMLAGFAGSEIVVAMGYDTGLRWYHFHDLIIYVFLPVLVFESALRIDARALLRNLLPILILAVPLMLLSAGLTAVLIYFGIAHPTGFPWIAALITGALLSATDPIGVAAVLKQSRAPPRLLLWLEGESLFNDATAIVLFNVLLAVAMSPESQADWADAAVSFGKLFFGGALVGLVIALTALGLLKLAQTSVLRGVTTLVSAYFAFYVAETALGLSGVMAVLVAGVLLGAANRSQQAPVDHQVVASLWGFLAYIATAVSFLLAGVTVTTEMFTERWLAMLLGIAAVLAARAVGVYLIVPVASRLPGSDAMPIGEQTVVFWGGLRGVVTLALALSLPVSLESWWTVQSIAYGVVLFSLFVQAPLIGPLGSRLRETA